MRFVFLFLALGMAIHAEESAAGVDLRATLTAGLLGGGRGTEAPRSGSGVTTGMRGLLYPTLKLNEHWSVSGAVDIISRPFYPGDLGTQGYGLKTNVLQGSLNYSRHWKRTSLTARTGMLSAAFGSFLLRYDDAVNPLIDMPLSYGYYYAPVGTLGLAGAEADVSVGKLDVRGQFVNSSPANRRSIFDRDQYGSWVTGAGYTIRQGLRAGFSTYRGPYLHRGYAFFFPGEAPPRSLPAAAFGIDVQYATGHWNVQGELQRFRFDYRAIPTFHEQSSYVEVRRVLHPRLFIAQRTGYLATSASNTTQAFEAVVGFRPGQDQLVKVGYQLRRITAGGPQYGLFELQMVSTIHPFSRAN